jgi:hypothetical protein
MSSPFLSPEEIVELTGFSISRKQIETLRKMGVVFLVNGLGRPVVLRHQFEAVDRISVSEPPAQNWAPRVLKRG